MALRERRGKPCFRLAHPEKKDGALHWVPDNFPAVFGSKHLALVDQLIMLLIKARNDLDDPERAALARDTIDRTMQALHDFHPDLVKDKHELILTALDASKMEGLSWTNRGMGVGAVVGKGMVPLDQFISGIWDLDLRTRLAETIIRNALPSVKLSKGVLQCAVELWPKTKQREARSHAIHELAKALGCDARTLLTQLRQARQRMRSRSPSIPRK
jgi:hypothetical protein